MGRGRQNTDRDCVVGYPDVLSLTDDSYPTVADLFQVAVMKDARFAQGGILANPGRISDAVYGFRSEWASQLRGTSLRGFGGCPVEGIDILGALVAEQQWGVVRRQGH
jgi:hypothetical protein